MTTRFILELLDYLLSISMCDSWLVLCPYQLLCNRNLKFVTNTQVTVLENDKCHSFCKLSPTFTSVSITLETKREYDCFLFLFENTVTKKRKTTCLFWSSIKNVNSLCSHHHYCQQLMLIFLCYSTILCYYRNTILNQSGQVCSNY